MNIYFTTQSLTGQPVKVLYYVATTATEARAILADLIGAGVEGVTCQ